MITMTARRVSRKPSMPIHFDAYGAPLRRMNVTEADRAEAAVMLNADSTDFDVVSPAPSTPSTAKIARKPAPRVWVYQRHSDEIYNPACNPSWREAMLEHFGWTEAACVD